MSMARDKAEFKRVVREWAKKLDVRVNTITLRPMKNKWASCSSEGNLTFNTELLGFDEDVRDYVIVHELLHFVAPNHGRLWKSLMRAHLGDYEALDLRLRRHPDGSLPA
jgi:predicted metal-dependent hydrolase